MTAPLIHPQSALRWLPVAAILTVTAIARLALGPGVEAVAVVLLAGWICAFFQPDFPTSIATAVGAFLIAITEGLAAASGCAVVVASSLLVVALAARLIGRPLTAVLLVASTCWPVLLSRYLVQSPNWLLDLGIFLNPCLAISAVVRDWTPWTELPWLYPRTSLGQDVGYLRPSPVTTTLCYMLAGIGSAVWLKTPPAPQKVASPTLSAPPPAPPPPPAHP